MNKISIIVPVCGNKDVVEECFNSLFPIPSGFELCVYNSKASDCDGTTQYLIDKQKENSFTLIQDGRTLRHSEAIETLMEHVKTEWILHIDSDVKIVNRDDFSKFLGLTSTEKYKVYGTVEQNHFVPKFRDSGGEDRVVSKLMLPRAYAWMILFKKSFYTNSGLSFRPMRLNVCGDFHMISDNLATSDSTVNEYACPVHTDAYYERGGSLPLSLVVVADTGWQLYWESVRADVFCSIPKDIWNSCVHIRASSVRWMQQNLQKSQADCAEKRKQIVERNIAAKKAAAQKRKEDLEKIINEREERVRTLIAERKAIAEKRKNEREEYFKNRKK